MVFHQSRWAGQKALHLACRQDRRQSVSFSAFEGCKERPISEMTEDLTEESGEDMVDDLCRKSSPRDHEG